MDGSIIDNAGDDFSISLPQPEFSNIDEIDSCLLRSAYSFSVKQRLVQQILDDGFIPKLFEIFRMSEDLENSENLFKLFSIFRSIVLLNNSMLLSELMSEEHILDFVGIFEHDPNFPNLKPGFRDYMRGENLFKELVTITDANILNLIHTTFRAQYLKDVVLARILDDETFSTFTFLIRTFQRSIVEELQTNPDFMQQLLPLLDSNDKATLKNVISFLKEYFSIAKTVPGSNIFKSIEAKKLLNFIIRCLRDHEGLDLMELTEILVHLIEFDCGKAREMMIKSDNELILFPQIIEGFNNNESMGIKLQFSQIIRLLCEPSIAVDNNRKLEEFLNVVYPVYSAELFKPFLDIKCLDAESANLLMDLLSSFIKFHKFRAKYLIIGSSILNNVARFMYRDVKYLNLAALRVLRTVLSCQDNYYHRFVVKHNLLEPLISLAKREEGKDNLLSSAVLEYFQFIISVILC